MGETRVMTVRKMFENSDGERTRSVTPDWTKLVFEGVSPVKDEDDNFVGIETFELARDKLEALPDMLACAAGYGISQKIGDSYAGLIAKAKAAGVEFDPKRGYVDFAMEIIQESVDNIMNGVWVTERETKEGGSVTILLEAIVRAFAAEGTELDETQVATFRKQLANEEFRSTVKQRADIKLHMSEIQAERAKARAQKAAAAAKEADTGNLAELLSA